MLGFHLLVEAIGCNMCLFPVRASRQEFGRPKLDPEGDLTLPCGKCAECKSKRASEWALRCKHEIACHDLNCFITLTYDDDHLPSFLIVKDEFQKFIKRLRKKIKTKLKYIVSHEYGGRSGRPHHHAIIFGWSPPNQSFLMEAPSGEPLYTSPLLDELWPHGFHSIGDANAKTAYYIASYSLKAVKHSVTDPETGELVTVSDSMDCSSRPAIGRNFFLENVDQILETEKMIPRYYKKLLERYYPDKFEELENKSADSYKTRGSYELLAKYEIIESQKDMSRNSLRSAPEEKERRKLYSDHLRSNRDFYKHLLDSKETIL
jgi:hypothetical protein